MASEMMEEVIAQWPRPSTLDEQGGNGRFNGHQSMFLLGKIEIPPRYAKIGNVNS
jgi:hypothetical protein